MEVQLRVLLGRRAYIRLLHVGTPEGACLRRPCEDCRRYRGKFQAAVSAVAANSRECPAAHCRVP